MTASPTATRAATRAATLGRRAEEVLERIGGSHRSLFFEGTWWTADELAGRARRAARGLQELGVRPGDRVVLCMANVPEVGIAYSALWRAGAVPTPVLFLLTEDELRHVAVDSGAVAFVTTPEFLPKVQAAAGGKPVVVVGGAPEGTVPWESLESGDELALVDRDVDDLAALLYTGGTTGRSKGVALSHANLDAAGAAGYRAGHVPGRTRGLLPLPLAHVYGLMVSCTGLHAVEPSESVLMRWFDPAGFVALVEEHRVQQSALVPSMIGMLLSQPLEEHDLSCLERVSSGGAPLAPELAVELERRVPGLVVKEGYGCTESSALIAAQPVDDRRLGSVGKPVQGVEVRIEGPDGEELPVGEDGEICVRGPVVMQGYWQQPDATAEVLRDGWFHTGDVGHLDEDGYLYVVDRIKDLIIRNGFNVYPRDVEDALLAHPEIAAAAVVGRPDPRVGEEVVAFVQLAPGSTLTEADVVEHAKQHVSAAKYPREVRIVDAVPLTSVLKTDRKALRKQLREG
ncbi:MAG TPA: AMP-binding protein [Mycobacteriales bacterium]|nr:AMP-binding protein [Mycobacteriales bacterium]